ncbi:predicted protein [Naegleria gruberi]|uniref:Predicted protein n=1 Tax=Naegleria gruberi TaxID=5762 RepID=D2VJ48_NAEGR|nr:uncharacterized protein NAEGRDRAFT_49967 [Naegleria gruberi]EFC43216.1 predicted protein [Naegleria gruberi]|eukprot:XP_002675960.1 predicted protein [Naegleria gruberi strain NEG-M]
MASKTEPSTKNSTSTTPYQYERRSGKCPVCFKHASCSHSRLLIKTSGFDKPFIGCYNRMVYQQAIVPEHQADLYDGVIINSVAEFASSLAAIKPASWNGYRGLLIAKLYEPIANFAKQMGFLPKDLILSIKEEKMKEDKKNNLINNNLKNNQYHDEDINPMMEDDVVSVDLGAVIDVDDEQMLPPSVLASDSDNTSSSNNTSPPSTTKSESTTTNKKKKPADLPQYKKAAIKKASAKKQQVINKQQVLSTIYTTSSSTHNNQQAHNVNYQIICVHDRSKKERRLVRLREQDFESVDSFHVALRRELQLNCGFKFEKLKFKLPGLKRSIDLKKSEMEIIAGFVRERKYDEILFRFGVRMENDLKLSNDSKLTSSE